MFFGICNLERREYKNRKKYIFERKLISFIENLVRR